MPKKRILKEHQVELLKKYYPIDEENKTVDIKIYYEKATDILDFTVGEHKLEMFSNEVLEKIDEVTNRIPDNYKANIIFVIDNYCDYDPKLLLEKLNDLIEINNYEIIRDKKKTWFISSLLVLVGFVILSLLGIGKEYNWFGSGIKADVITEAIDITSWVFIWQAVTLLFLSPTNLERIGTSILTRVDSITFKDSKNNELASETKEDIISDWELDTKINNFRKSSLLVFSTLLVAISFYRLSHSIIVAITNTNQTNMVLEGGFSLINLVVLLAGISGIEAYLNKGNIRQFLKPVIYVLFVLKIVSLTLSFIFKLYNQLPSDFVVLLVIIIFIVVDIARRYKKNKMA